MVKFPTKKIQKKSGKIYVLPSYQINGSIHCLFVCHNIYIPCVGRSAVSKLYNNNERVEAKFYGTEKNFVLLGTKKRHRKLISVPLLKDTKFFYFMVPKFYEQNDYYNDVYKTGTFVLFIHKETQKWFFNTNIPLLMI